MNSDPHSRTFTVRNGQGDLSPSVSYKLVKVSIDGATANCNYGTGSTFINFMNVSGIALPDGENWKTISNNNFICTSYGENAVNCKINSSHW